MGDEDTGSEGVSILLKSQSKSDFLSLRTLSHPLLWSLPHCHLSLPMSGFAHTAQTALDPWASVFPAEAQPRRPSQDHRICSGLCPHQLWASPTQPLISFHKSSVAYLILMLVLNSLRIKSMTHSSSLPPSPAQMFKIHWLNGAEPEL